MTSLLTATVLKARVEISYHICCSNGWLEPFTSNAKWRVSRAEGLHIVPIAVNQDCANILERWDTDVRIFFKSGKELSTEGLALANLRAFIVLPSDGKGGRAHYVNKSQFDAYRINCIGDLFTDEEVAQEDRPPIPVRVYGELVQSAQPEALLSGSQEQLPFSLSVPMADKFRRLGTRPVTGSRPRTFETEHNNAFHAILAPQAGGRSYLALCLDVNGSLIGPLCNLAPFSRRQSPYSRRHESTSNDQRVSELPTFTFRNYTNPQSSLPGKLISNQSVNLAIRLVNTLADPALQAILCPAPAYMSVSAKRKRQSHYISIELQNLLKSDRFSPAGGIGPENSPHRLFDNDREKKWHLELWVLPQKHEGKLYRFKDDNLVRYLDWEMVEMGNLKLYMEAHIVRDWPNDFSDYFAPLDVLPVIEKQ